MRRVSCVRGVCLLVLEMRPSLSFSSLRSDGVASRCSNGIAETCAGHREFLAKTEQKEYDKWEVLQVADPNPDPRKSQHTRCMTLTATK